MWACVVSAPPPYTQTEAKVPDRYIVTMKSKIKNNFSEGLSEITEDGEDTGLNIRTWFKKGVIGNVKVQAAYKLCSDERFEELGCEISRKQCDAKQQLDEAKCKDAPDEVVKAGPVKRRRTTKASEVKAEDPSGESARMAQPV